MQNAQPAQRPAGGLDRSFRSIDYSYSDARPTSGVAARPAGKAPVRGKAPARTSVRPAAQAAVRTAPRRSRTGQVRRRGSETQRPGGGDSGSVFLSSVLKAVMYIAFIFVCAGFLSYYVINVGNDVFAFVKDDSAISVTFGEFATINDIADTLSENGIIEYPDMFVLYAKLRKKADVDFLAGTYTLSPSMNYDSLIAKLRKSTAPARTEISITIREGLTVDEIIDLFLSYGIGTRDGFVDVIQNDTFDFWFMEFLTPDKLSPDRTYRLEGYLFPDTYYFYSDSSERTAIYKLLYRFNQQFDERYRESCEALGMTVDEVITLSSMIQSEAKFVTDYGLISSVFHNRLNKPSAETQGYLQSDATVQYFLTEHKKVVDSADLEIDNPYNTYLYKGLPPGPICNPSLDAMSYALYPDASSYFYFVAKSDGWNLFAKTHAEHLANIREARGG